MIMYGRGENSIAEQLGCEVEEAREIKEDVYAGFPAIRQFEEDSIRMVREKGYVTTLWGRKRRLPNFNLPEYELKYYDEATNTYTPVEPFYRDEWLKQIYKETYFRKRLQVIAQLEKKHGIKVFSNSSKIADAQRQIINSRVQGSAADMSKKAMIAVANNPELKNIGFRILVPVHDELIGEAPLRHAIAAKELFAHSMETAAEDRLTIPISCDVTCSYEWYGDELNLEKEIEELS